MLAGMPGFVVSPETLKINVHWTLHGRPQLNVLHGHFPTVGPPDPAMAQNLRNAAVTALTSTNYLTVLASTTSFAQIGVTDLRFEGVPEVLSTGTPVPGTAVAPAMPDQVSFVYTLRTGKTGRSFRGRIYSLGWSTSTIGDNGQSDVASAEAGRLFYDALRTAMSGQGAAMAIRSPALPERPSKPGGTLPEKPFAITVVTSIETRDLLFDTNRRRTDILRR
jgi:hypothetical protein